MLDRVTRAIRPTLKLESTSDGRIRWCIAFQNTSVWPATSASIGRMPVTVGGATNRLSSMPGPGTQSSR